MDSYADDPRLLAAACHGLQPVRNVHRNPYFSVHDRGGFFTVDTDHPQVIVLPVVNRDNVLLVRVKRPVLADQPLELPAGGARQGESVRDAALRELAEETGVVVSGPHRLKICPPLAGDPNRNPCLAHVFRLDLSMDEYTNRGRHDQEIREVVLMNREQCMQAVKKGEIYVTTPLAVICRDFLFRSPTE